MFQPQSGEGSGEHDRPKKKDVYDRIPYDWENDKLESLDDEKELRPWALDEFYPKVVVERPGSFRKHATGGSRLSRWNPFSKRDEHVPQPPIHSRARLSTTDAGTLIVDLPAAGMDSRAISSGVFGTLWFSAIAPATFAGGIFTAAFLLPFWLAGAAIAKTAVVDPFVNSQLTIGQYAWSLKSNYGNAKIRQVEGSTQDLRGASVEDLRLEVNGKPFYEIKLHGVNGATGFGNGLEPEELDYLAYVINNHLEGLNQDRDDGVYGYISGLGRD